MSSMKDTTKDNTFPGVNYKKITLAFADVNVPKNWWCRSSLVALQVVLLLAIIYIVYLNLGQYQPFAASNPVLTTTEQIEKEQGLGYDAVTNNDKKNIINNEPQASVLEENSEQIENKPEDTKILKSSLSKFLHRGDSYKAPLSVTLHEANHPEDVNFAPLPENFNPEATFAEKAYGLDSTKWPTVNDISTALQRVKLADKEILEDYLTKSLSLKIKPWDIKQRYKTRTPCWYDAKADTDRCLPYFYFGGFPKCATTDLWYRLKRHPEVLKVPVKEPGFWPTRRLLSVDSAQHIPMSRYTDLYKGAKNGDLIAGDGSTGTANRDQTLSRETRFSEPLWEETETLLRSYRLLTVQIIHAYTPKAKYIMMLRNPVDEVWSFYLHRCHGKSEMPSQEEFHKHVVDQIKTVENCQHNHNIRYCTYDLEGEYKHQTPVVSLNTAMYIIYINDLLKAVPAENVLILNFLTYVTHREQAVMDVFEFLDIEADNRILDMERFDNEKNSRKKDVKGIGEMWPVTRNLLKKFFVPFNKVLASYLKDDSYLFEDIAM